MNNADNLNLYYSSLRGYTGIQGLSIYENLLFNAQSERPYSLIIAPHLKDFVVDDLATYRIIARARADALALRQQHSCSTIYHRYCPADNLAKLLFEWFEQLRVEACCSEHLMGTKKNLLLRFQQWSLHFFHHGLLEQQLMLLIFTVGQMLWARLNNQVVVEMVDGVLEETRSGISALVGKPIAEMKKQLLHQEQFAKTSLLLIKEVCALIEQEYQLNRSGEDSKSSKQTEINKWLSFISEKEHSLYSQSMGYTESHSKSHNPLASYHYPIFTTEFDTISSINQLVRHQQMIKFQQQQRHKPPSERLRTNPNWLTQQLIKAFSCQQSTLQKNHPSGYIDAAKLVPLVLSNNEEKPFYAYQPTLTSQGQLTILIDCSGSMKMYVSWILDWLSLIIPCAERANINTEILGFTTRTWNGGRASKKWQQQPNKQTNPGRLNELSHIILKQKHQRWQQTQLHLMGLLKADLFKEGIDGEAILWATSRMTQDISQHTQQKNVLLVISDGHPMDSETMLNNSLTFLSEHLNAVLISVQKKSHIDVIGIGLNENLPPSFQKQAVFFTSDPINPQSLLPLIKHMA